VARVDVTEVAGGVWWVRGTAVNWYLIRDGDAVTLIDAGYPGDADGVEESVRMIGRDPKDVQAVLLTHAHVDHLGGVKPFHDRHGTPLLVDPVELEHARRERLEQVGPGALIANAWRPGVLPWVARIVRAGATRDPAAPFATAFEPGVSLDLPGAPRPVPTPGHTSGHSAYLLPGAGAVVSGDALVTAHPTTRIDGPQLLPEMYHHDDAAARASLSAIAGLDADLLLPGHGPPRTGSVSDAVASALDR